MNGPELFVGVPSCPLPRATRHEARQLALPYTRFSFGFTAFTGFRLYNAIMALRVLVK